MNIYTPHSANDIISDNNLTIEQQLRIINEHPLHPRLSNKSYYTQQSTFFNYPTTGKVYGVNKVVNDKNIF